MHREDLQFNNQKTKNIITKWTKAFKRYLTKEDTLMGNKHTKGYLTSLVIRERKLKTTVQYHYTTTKMALKKKKSSLQSVDKNVKQMEFHTLLFRMENGKTTLKMIWLFH